MKLRPIFGNYSFQYTYYRHMSVGWVGRGSDARLMLFFFGGGGGGLPSPNTGRHGTDFFSNLLEKNAALASQRLSDALCELIQSIIVPEMLTIF